MNPGYQLRLEVTQAGRAKLEQTSTGGGRVASQPLDVDAVTDGWKRLEQPNAVIELHRRAVEVAVPQEVVHAHPDLQDAFVQVADLARRGTPEKLEGFVLFKELTRVELVYRFAKLRRSRLRAGHDQVSRAKPLKRAAELGMRRSRVGGGQRKGYTPATYERGGRRTMTFASVQELVQGTRPVLDFNGGLRIKDSSALRGETIDRLVHTAVFGEGDVREVARWVIWEAGWEVGVKSASIDSLYQARAREEYANLTVPAMNVRAMAYDFARAIVASAKRRDVGAFIFELARSEMGYTNQSCEEFATVMMAASIKEGHAGPIFIQGDHYQADAKKYATDPQGVIDGLKKLIREAIAAGYGNIDIDTSTLVKLSFPTLAEQQRENYGRCAELAALIRELEPRGVTISIGGEIGEVGKKNSTVDELEAFIQGFNSAFRARVGDKRGLSKISVNTGSSHGGVVLPDGTIAKVAIDFDTLREMSAAARRYGMGGAVQHGASTLPPEYFHKFPEVGTLEVHLATEFQNIILDHGAFPEDLKQQTYAYIREKLRDEWASGDTEEQFIYKTRKKIWGPFKQQTWTLPEATRSAIRALLMEKLDFLYEQLGVVNSQSLIQRHIPDAKRISKPQPEALKAIAA